MAITGAVFRRCGILPVLCILLVLPFASMAQMASGDATAPRLALVIGNTAYRNAQPLPNAGRDAQDVARVLEGMGFAVTLLIDLDRTALNGAIREFGLRSQGASVALLYYAGHGLQMARGVQSDNFIVPVDARLIDVHDVDDETIAVSRIIDRLEGAASRIIILDACRDNPLAGQMRGQTATRNVTRGLVRMELNNPGTLLVYSTDPGSVALDGTGRNSPFARALIEYLPTPGLDVRLILTRVRASVLAATQGRQRPWSTDGLLQDVILQPALPSTAMPAPAPSATTDDPAADVAFWNSVKDSNDPRELDAYAQAFPNGRFIALARARLERLRAGTRPPVDAAAGQLRPDPASAALSNLPAPRQPGFIATPSGCRLWHAGPRHDEAVVWTGECRDGLATGYGSGEWRGEGGSVRFAATLADGHINGPGRLEWSNGERYEGYLRDGRPHGAGVLQMRDGRRYEGYFLDGVRTGLGRLLLPSGDRYEGTFVNGERSGRGVFFFANGDRYEGEFLDNLWQGPGTYVFAGGTRYVGSFERGLAVGSGTVTLSDGQRFNAQARDGCVAWGTGGRMVFGRPEGECSAR